LVSSCCSEVWKGDHLKERSLENQPKNLWEVVFINNKAQTKERGNVIGKLFNLDVNCFRSRTILCQCDSCGINFNNISKLIINKKNYLGKKSDAFNACGKLLLNTEHENILTREKSDFFKNRKTLSHHEDPIYHKKIQTLEQNFEYNMCRETFEKAIFDTHKRENSEENDFEYNEYGRTFCGNSSILFHQIPLSKVNHLPF
ncbi:PREDICTED: zinc finger protein 33A-like, partial [Galeopterus variegatus]|uniref:Zinc finger protein 33A-like n=1 Tax=Galeopterus variegatus TaxID=482537 RepID=A0ABM0PYR9_GALVR